MRLANPQTLGCIREKLHIMFALTVTSAYTKEVSSCVIAHSSGVVSCTASQVQAGNFLHWESQQMVIFDWQGVKAGMKQLQSNAVVSIAMLRMLHVVRMLAD